MLFFSINHSNVIAFYRKQCMFHCFLFFHIFDLTSDCPYFLLLLEKFCLKVGYNAFKARQVSALFPSFVVQWFTISHLFIHLNKISINVFNVSCKLDNKVCMQSVCSHVWNATITHNVVSLFSTKGAEQVIPVAFFAQWFSLRNSEWSIQHAASQALGLTTQHVHSMYKGSSRCSFIHTVPQTGSRYILAQNKHQPDSRWIFNLVTKLVYDKRMIFF